MNMRENGPAIYAAGGVLIYGWQCTNIWPAQSNASTLKPPQKVADAALGFKTEGGAETFITWDNAMAFEVSQDDFHQFLLTRRKAAANGAAHAETTR
jgi:hypothetical protein